MTRCGRYTPVPVADAGAPEAAASGSAAAAARRLGGFRGRDDWRPPMAGRDMRAALMGSSFQPNRLRVLLGAVAAGAVLTVLAMWQNAASDARLAGQSQVAGDAVMHSQRFAKAAPIALRGDPQAFLQVEESRAELGRELDLLARGGQSPAGRIPAASGQRADDLQKAIVLWNRSSKASANILGNRRNLIAFGASLAQYEEVAPGTDRHCRTPAARRDHGRPAPGGGTEPAVGDPAPDGRRPDLQYARFDPERGDLHPGRHRLGRGARRRPARWRWPLCAWRR